MIVLRKQFSMHKYPMVTLWAYSCSDSFIHSHQHALVPCTVAIHMRPTIWSHSPTTKQTFDIRDLYIHGSIIIIYSSELVTKSNHQLLYQLLEDLEYTVIYIIYKYIIIINHIHYLKSYTLFLSVYSFFKCSFLSITLACIDSQIFF